MTKIISHIFPFVLLLAVIAAAVVFVASSSDTNEDSSQTAVSQDEARIAEQQSQSNTATPKDTSTITSDENTDSTSDSDSNNDTDEASPNNSTNDDSSELVSDPPLIFTGFGHRESNPLKATQSTSTTCTSAATVPCFIRFVQGDTVIEFDSKTTDSQGVALWSWQGADVGSGEWLAYAIVGNKQSNGEVLYLE